jgi:hypothetical protein
MLVNDFSTPTAGRLQLTLTKDRDNVLTSNEIPFAMPALGDQTLALELAVPGAIGPATLNACAISDQGERTVSRRWIRIIPGP